MEAWDPDNIGKRSMLIAWEPGNTGKRSILITWELGNTEILTLGYLYKKRRAPKNDEDSSDFRAEISHMRPIQGQKLKLFITPFCGVINLPVE